MLAQRARLLALYVSLVYNSWKHKTTTEKPNMIFFINSGEKSSQPKNIPSLYKTKSHALLKAKKAVSKKRK